jgi:hypothetical protein
VTLEESTRLLEERDARLEAISSALRNLLAEVTLVGGFARHELLEALREARLALDDDASRQIAKPRTRTWPI